MSGEEMRVVVIGSGAAGLTTASTIRRYNKEMEIVVITKDKYIAYSPCAIPYVICNEIPSFEDIIMHTPEEYKKDRHIDVITESEVLDVDSENNKIIYKDKENNEIELTYDYLVLATGGSPFVPPIEGVDLKGVFKLRTIEDGMKIKEYAENSKSAIVAGAGAIGLETAYALKELGLDVIVVEMAPQILPRALDIDMAKIVMKYLEEDVGIKFIHEKCHTDIRVWSTEGKGLVNKELEDMGIACKIVPFRWPCRKVTLMKNIPNFIRHLRKEKPDIIHTHAYRDHFFSVILSKIFKIPEIFL